MKPVVHTTTETWYYLDDNFNVWSDPVKGVSLCLTQTPELKKEGELRELERQIAQLRKELGFLQSETLEEGYRRLLNLN